MVKLSKKFLGNLLILLALLLFVGWLSYIPATDISYYLVQHSLKSKWVNQAPPSASNTTFTSPQVGEPVARLKIKKIALDAIVLEGATTNNLRKGPAHLGKTPAPGEKGNCVISGHRVTYGAPFRKLDSLAKGDLIEVFRVDGKKFLYQVEKVYSTLSADQSVLTNSTDFELTLTTCDPPHSARQRLIVKARMLSN
jgi:sortase A